jgi:anthranilate synthase component 1
LDEFKRLAAEYTIVPVCSETLADMDTPVSVLLRFAGDENVFLLESMEGGEKWGRYSFLGIRPQLLFEVDHMNPGSTDRLDALRKVYANERVAPIPDLPRFIGGAVGFIGYEAISEFETMPIPGKPDSNTFPCSKFVRADRVIVFDNVKHTVKVVVCTHPGAFSSPEAAYEEARGQIEDIESVLREARPPVACEAFEKVSFESNMSREQFCKMVESAKNYIYAGDIIQAVLSQRFSARTSTPPLQIYRALRLLNPSPYTFFLKIGGQALVGSSPEVMVRLTGDRIELRPIAGTRPRGSTEQEDRRLADELLSDDKEKAEHVMLVDLGRNDVGRVAQTGSVQVREYMVVERYSHVMHLVSHVEGILKKGFDAFDVIGACFPAGTLTGAPKIRAMQIISELEPGPRGTYGGAIGYIGYDGNMDLAITIRTVQVANGTASVQAGAGIVFDSDPTREFEETCHKARGMQRAVEMAGAGLKELD